MMLIILIILVAAIILNSYITSRDASTREYQHDRRTERFERLMTMLQIPGSNKNDDTDSYRESDIRDDDNPDTYRDKS